MVFSLMSGLIVLAAASNDAPTVPFTPDPRGFVSTWLLGGPFPYPPGRDEADAALIKDHLTGETGINPTEGDPMTGTIGPAERRWTLLLGSSEIIELDERFEPNADVLTYAFATVVSPADIDAMIQLGSTGAMRVFFNGELVYDHRTERKLVIDDGVTAIRLQRGPNALLVKTGHVHGPWRFALRVTDRQSRPIPGLYAAARTSRDPGQLAKCLGESLRLVVSPNPITRPGTASLILHAPPCRPVGLEVLRLGFGVEPAGEGFHSLLVRNLAANQREADAPWNTSDLADGTYTAVVKVQGERGETITELRAACEKIQTHPVRVVLRDRDTARPVDARVSITDSQGRDWTPEGHRPAGPVDAGEGLVIDGRSYTRVKGRFTVYVPDGPIDLRVNPEGGYASRRESWSETIQGDTRVIQLTQGGDFIPIFDGKTLSGWKAHDMSYWSVEDGAITAKIAEAHPCTINQYLVWQGGELGDFELRLTFRMISDQDVNGGFQFRSKLLPDDDVAGYQVDNDTRGGWLVRLYDEHGRHTLAFRGKRADIAADGTITHTDIPDAAGEPGFRLDQWHTYDLIARGPRLTLKVNDRLMAEVNDGDPKQYDAKGILALQLHSGPPMTVQFKDIQLKRLTNPKK